MLPLSTSTPRRTLAWTAMGLGVLALSCSAGGGDEGLVNPGVSGSPVAERASTQAVAENVPSPPAANGAAGNSGAAQPDTSAAPGTENVPDEVPLAPEDIAVPGANDDDDPGANDDDDNDQNDDDDDDDDQNDDDDDDDQDDDDDANPGDPPPVPGDPPPVAGDPPPVGAVTFTDDIYPILVTNCGRCHSGGGLPNFASANIDSAFTTAVRESGQMVSLISQGEMPADTCSGPPGSNGCVSVANFTLIQEWVAGGRLR